MEAFSSAVAVVRELVSPLSSQSDMKHGIEDERFLEPTRRLVAEDAVIEFPVPGGGFVGAMGGPFRGPAGFEEGWREWLQAWDEFTITEDELIEGARGQVLLLASARGRLKGSETAVEQGVAALYEISAGRVTRIEHFLDQDQARVAAGLR